MTRMWTRGRARVEGNEIVLDAKKAKPYRLFEDPAQHERLLIDLAELRKLGIVANRRILNKRVRNPSLAKDFARRHGLIWHQPEEGGDCRETWQSWLVAGYELSLTIALYAELREAITTGPVEPLRSFLRTTRDTGNAFGAIPEDNQELLEHVSILLAERITKGLIDCSPTILAACSLEREGGMKEGPAGDFRASINPSSLLAVAYNELAALIESKAWFKECAGCGKLFRLDPNIHHRDRAYCEDACYDRTRKREQRARRRTSTQAAGCSNGAATGVNGPNSREKQSPLE